MFSIFFQQSVRFSRLFECHKLFVGLSALPSAGFGTVSPAKDKATGIRPA